MIPEFPTFKKLSLSDKQEIGDIIGKLSISSDFNFTSLWCWNTTGNLLISNLNGNLVVRFSDYMTGESFLSFYGEKELAKTAQLLLQYNACLRAPAALKLIPESVVENMNDADFEVVEDRGSFDYIFNIDTFLFLNDPRLYVKRKHLRYFQKTFAFEVEMLQLDSPMIKQDIIDLCHAWASMKMDKNGSIYFRTEFLAILQYLNTPKDDSHIAVGVYCHGKLVAFSLSENVSDDTNVCHFQKAVTNSYKGLNVFLVHTVAKVLAEKGIRYVNWEQDLDIPGLRENKESYLPYLFLKK